MKRPENKQPANPQSVYADLDNLPAPEYKPEDYLLFHLQDLAYDLLAQVRELKETGSLEPGSLKGLSRRMLAAYLAAADIFFEQGTKEAIVETLRNPHRMRGVEMP